jgi:hypothetical protein
LRHLFYFLPPIIEAITISPTTPTASVVIPIGPRHGSGMPSAASGAKQPADVAVVVEDDDAAEEEPEDELELEPPEPPEELGAADTVKLIAGAETPPTDHVSDHVPT